MPKIRKQHPHEVELASARLVLTIRAEFDLRAGDDAGEGVTEAITDALDTLRGYGSADVIDRRIVGVPKTTPTTRTR